VVVVDRFFPRGGSRSEPDARPRPASGSVRPAWRSSGDRLARRARPQGSRPEDPMHPAPNSPASRSASTPAMPGSCPTSVSGAVVRFRSSHLVLAKGSAPSRLVIPGAELTVAFHDLFRLGAGIGFPAHPVIISGGHIHVDVASLQEHLEASPLILEVTPGAPTGFDAELTERLHRTFGSRVEIRTAAFVTAIVRLGDGYRVPLPGRYRRRSGHRRRGDGTRPPRGTARRGRTGRSRSGHFPRRRPSTAHLQSTRLRAWRRERKEYALLATLGEAKTTLG
jgi:hypothetical protein